MATTKRQELAEIKQRHDADMADLNERINIFRKKLNANSRALAKIEKELETLKKQELVRKSVE